MNSIFPTKSLNQPTIKKSRPLSNSDENQHPFQYNRTNSSKNQQFQTYVPSPLSTLSCSININQLTNQQSVQKGISNNLSTRQQSPRISIAKPKLTFQKTNNLLMMLQKRQIIGKGGFGKVWRVQFRGTDKCLALKEMSKALVIAKKSVPSVMNEKSLLVSLQNPFIVNLLQAHQDRQNLYLILDYLPGGDLRHHLARKRFNEEQAKFMCVCILLGLKYLHSKGVIHRDIKPQNIVLDKHGYARITDLGVARPYRTNNSSDTSGTPGYMAPQVLCRQNHSYSVDYFALGVMAHQMMLRKRPFQGRSRKQIREQVLARQVQIRKHQIPDDWSLQSADFINKLLMRKPIQRLGNNSIQDILKHPWLRNFPIQKVAAKSLSAPWFPDLRQNRWDEDDISSQQAEMKELVAQNQLMLRNEQVQQLFQGYQHSRPISKFY